MSLKLEDTLQGTIAFLKSFKMMMGVADSDKHTRLFQCGVNYRGKKFYSTDFEAFQLNVN